MTANKTGIYTLICISLLLAAVCSTTKEPLSEEAIFYPPAPGEPRLQYLTSFSDSSDLVAPANAFKKFLLGDSSTDISGIVKPYGMAIQGTKLYVCDTIGAQVHAMDFEARTWEHFRPAVSGGIKKIIHISVDSENVRYVSDPLRGEVIINSPDGQFVAAIAGEEKMKPVGLAVSEDRIIIGDLEQKKVHVFDKESRELLFSIPRNADNEAAKIFAPTNIALDQKGNIYVSDTGAFRVQKYGPDGDYIRTYGVHGDSPGQFARNKGIAVDRNGILYAVDAASQTVQMFDDEGNLLLFFGEQDGSEAPLVLPADVVIDYDNIALFQSYAHPDFKLEHLIFVTNQYGPRKVAVYGFGNMTQP